MNALTKYFETYTSDEGRLTYKVKSYARVYAQWLERFRGTEVTLAEVGIGKGGCLQMWRSYLGPLARIYGIDHDDQLCYTEPQIECICGDQGDPAFLARLPSLLPSLDIFVDDGSHVNTQQVATLEAIFPILKPGGLYFCEDTHTSYREQHYGGGYLHDNTFIEYCKRIPDAMHHTEDTRIPTTSVTQHLESASFYPGLVVLQKEGGMAYA